MKTESRRIGTEWYLFLGDRPIYGPESYQLVSDVGYFFNSPEHSDNSEAAEVAGVLRKAHSCGLI